MSKNMDKQELLKTLPSVDEILKSKYAKEWQEKYPRIYVLRAIRNSIEKKRKELLEGKTPDITTEVIVQEIEILIKDSVTKRLGPVINATGIVIHTNLGRASLSDEALHNIYTVAQGYSNLEYNLYEGKRGKRYDHIKWILRDLTGAEDAIVVNNNAAAVLLCLSAIARGREVIISRGELVEIGGSFRIPDVMVQSGAILKEIGTTNKTHFRDYESAINENTALLLKVHQSNYRLIGFTEDVSIDELVSLGRRKGIPVMFDLGSGCFIDLTPYGINGEPVVCNIIKKGVDIVTFSGDKLLGGPQAGIIVGRNSIIDLISEHPLARAVRIDKLTLSALEATLFQYADLEGVRDGIPVLRFLLQGEREIKRRAQKIWRLIKKDIRGVIGRIERDVSQAGGGSLPGIYLPTYVVTVKAAGVSSAQFEERLRKGIPPVITRIKEGKVVLDARTIKNSEVKPLVKAIKKALDEFFT